MQHLGNCAVNLFWKRLWKSAACLSKRLVQRKCFPSALRWGIQSELCLFKTTFLLFVTTDVLKVTAPTTSCFASFSCKEFLRDSELVRIEGLFVCFWDQYLKTLWVSKFDFLVLGCQVLFKIDLYINVIKLWKGFNNLNK